MGAEALDERQEVGGGLAGARGGDAQNVAVGDHDGNGLHLNGRGLLVLCALMGVTSTTEALDVAEHHLLELRLLGGEGHLVEARDGVGDVSAHHGDVQAIAELVDLVLPTHCAAAEADTI